MATKDKVNLDDIADHVVENFFKLNLFEQRLSLDLYRLLAEGQPVPRARLAQPLGMTVESVETVDRILNGWPGVFSDQQRRVIGYWGLAISTAYTSPHQITIGGQSLSAWCAWDTFFLPELLGQTAEIESTSQDSGGTVCLTVSLSGWSMSTLPVASCRFSSRTPAKSKRT